MQTQMKELIQKAKLNANKHGWLISWDKYNCKECMNNEIKILSIGDSIALLHSELSEMLEAYRDNNINQFNEEIADEFIRLFHLCGDLNIDIEKEIYLKMNKNKLRPKNHGRKNY